VNAHLTRGLALAAAALFFLSPGRASAKGIILITHGDTINHVADIKNPLLLEVMHKDGWTHPAIGYKYSYFGIFWLDLWTWGGEYCIYEDKKYMPLTPELAEAAGVSEKELKKPFLYRFPLGLVILLTLGMVGGFSAWMRRGQSDAES
jgi:hypothetical protein